MNHLSEHPMKKTRRFFRLRASVLAVQGALTLSGAAFGQGNPTLDELTRPSNQVEIGLGATDNFSAKANEYNGITHDGAFGIAGFALFGGGAYDSADATRWRLVGTDLGLKSRSVNGEYGEQGRFRIKLDYDQLWRNLSDSFQTPYTSAGSVFSLPAAWRVPLVPRLSATSPNARGLSPEVTASNAIVSGASTAPTAAQLATAAAVQAADLPAFNTTALSTRREQIGLGGEIQLDTRWSLAAHAAHEHKDGLKPLSAITRIVGGDHAATLAQPVDQDHRQYHLGLNYTGDGALLQAAYDASLFTNQIASVSWSAWSDPTKLQSMGTAPSNQFHKLSLAGHYALSPATKLTGSLSYGRATQNETYLNDGLTTLPLLPASSLNGLVVTEAMSLKVQSKLSPQLNLGAGYKFDLRDNRTPVSTYGYYDTGEPRAAANSVFGAQYGSNINLNANRPYSKRGQQLTLDADYRLQAGQKITAGWETQDTDKYCSGSWINCVDASHLRQHAAKLDFHLAASDALSARVGVLLSQRKVDYDENAFLALVPMANVSPTGAPAGATAYSTLVALGLTGYGPVSGLTPAAAAGSAQAFFFPSNNALSNSLYANANRISELPGMRRYNNANRDRGRLQGSMLWQASETFSLQANGDYNRDNYSQSVFGLQKAENWALHLEGTFVPSDDLSLSVFASHEDQQARSAGNSYTANSTAANVGGATAISGGCYATIALRNASNKIDPCLNWTANTTDKTDTLGFTLARNGLLSGKLDLSASLFLSQARSVIDVNGGSYVNNPYAGSTAAGAISPTVAAWYIPATALPTVKTDAAELRLGGSYRLDKQRTLRLAYGYQTLRTSDWAYAGLQPGGLAGVLPTLEQSPHYQVHSVGLSYVASF